MKTLYSHYQNVCTSVLIKGIPAYTVTIHENVQSRDMDHQQVSFTDSTLINKYICIVETSLISYTLRFVIVSLPYSICLIVISWGGINFFLL